MTCEHIVTMIRNVPTNRQIPLVEVSTMLRNTLAILILLAGLATLTCNSAWADDCCIHCGCHAHLQKVCRLVPDEKKVTKTHYDVKCEDICLPGRSHKCGCEWIPSCGKVKTVKKLVKVDVTKKVPSFKCVVETICCDCCQRLAAAEDQDTVEAPKSQLAKRILADPQ
jgi:hypothetical protein